MVGGGWWSWPPSSRSTGGCWVVHRGSDRLWCGCVLDVDGSSCGASSPWRGSTSPGSTSCTWAAMLAGVGVMDLPVDGQLDEVVDDLGRLSPVHREVVGSMVVTKMPGRRPRPGPPGAAGC